VYCAYSFGMLFNIVVASFDSGILHISNISRARIDNIECLFCVGEQVRVMVVPSNIKRKLSFRYFHALSWFLLYRCNQGLKCCSA